MQRPQIYAATGGNTSANLGQAYSEHLKMTLRLGSFAFLSVFAFLPLRLQSRRFRLRLKPGAFRGLLPQLFPILRQEIVDAADLIGDRRVIRTRKVLEQ